MPRAGYTIGELARDFAITTRTLRFYEEHGLLAPKRIGTLNTTRLYSESDRLNLMAVLEAKRLGYTIDGIKDLKDGADAIIIPADTIRLQLERLAAQREEIARAMTHLRTLEAEREAA